MKAKISTHLENILRDEQARELLRRHLIDGKDGQIVVGNIRYRLSTRTIERGVAEKSEPKKVISSR
jgi:hypothetical protein